jgi:hydroxymethylglutaryl-CoA reductase (NADPH)
MESAIRDTGYMIRNTHMDLRSLPTDSTPPERVELRRRMIEQELGKDLSMLRIDPRQLGHAEERNCENMFGAVPIPVGLAGPQRVTFSDGTQKSIYLPLATTEAALVASVNRGCKALRESSTVGSSLAGCGRVHTTSKHHGASRSIALTVSNWQLAVDLENNIRKRDAEWKYIGESTSNHLKILSYDIDLREPYIFLTIAADTDEAMGMNMATIAAQAIGTWLENAIHQAQPSACARFVTVAANVESDKKPSKRTLELGRGYEVTATCILQPATIANVLKTTPEAMLEAAHAKLNLGSELAGALGRNLHAANVIASLFLATGQDAAHVVEGSMAETFVEPLNERMNESTNPRRSHEALSIRVRIPALLVGIRGGGTTLPAQQQCLDLLLDRQSPIPQSSMHPCRMLAEGITAAVLAGEISLLAAQASHTLAKAHQSLARDA